MAKMVDIIDIINIGKFKFKYLENDNGDDMFDKVLNKFGSPLYLYYEKPMRENAKKFMSAFIENIPKFKQYFAVKATPNKHILKILNSEGMGFDCSSITELKLVESLYEVNTKQLEIMYTSNYTSVEDFEDVLKIMSESNSNIIINLDDTDGLENLCTASVNTNIKLPDLISFRLNPLFGSTSSEVESNVLGGPNTKFGVPSTRIVDAYELAKTQGFTRFGIHVMTGSCILEIEYFKKLVDVVFEYINKIYQELGIIFEFIDLGGGIGIPYRPEQTPIDINLLAKTIADTIQENKKKYNLHFDPIIVMENGRYITGPYGILLSRCKSIKYGVDNKKFYGLDACMANLMRPGMYGAYHKIIVPRLINQSKSTDLIESVNIVGSLCENNDWFAKDRLMPKNIIKNDIFVIFDVGAHGYSMGFQYNSKTRSAEALVTDDEQYIIEIREKELNCFN